MQFPIQLRCEQFAEVKRCESDRRVDFIMRRIYLCITIGASSSWIHHCKQQAYVQVSRQGCVLMQKAFFSVVNAYASACRRQRGQRIVSTVSR